jgi:hypothetical protein
MIGIFLHIGEQTVRTKIADVAVADQRGVAHDVAQSAKPVCARVIEVLLALSARSVGNFLFWVKCCHSIEGQIGVPNGGKECAA